MEPDWLRLYFRVLGEMCEILFLQNFPKFFFLTCQQHVKSLTSYGKPTARLAFSHMTDDWWQFIPIKNICGIRGNMSI